MCVYFMALKILPMFHFNYLLFQYEGFIYIYILDANPSLDNYFLNVFSDSVCYLLMFTVVLFSAKVSCFKSQLSVFLGFDLLLCVVLQVLESDSYMQSVFHFVHDVNSIQLIHLQAAVCCPGIMFKDCSFFIETVLSLQLHKAEDHDSVLVHTWHRICNRKGKAYTLGCINNNVLTLAHWSQQRKVLEIQNWQWRRDEGMHRNLGCPVHFSNKSKTTHKRPY